MLSPKAEEDIMTAQNKAERGIRTIEEQDSNTSALFSLLTEMREEMKRRNEEKISAIQGRTEMERRNTGCKKKKKT